MAILALVLTLLAACTPSATPTATTVHPTTAPVDVPSPTALPATPIPTAAPAIVEITVYFTDENRYALGTPPFEVGVTRAVPASANLPEAVLAEFFSGPTAEESARGLVRINSGFTGFSRLTVEGGIARISLTGPCASNGATYSIAQLLLKNLLQFPEIEYVKIYDADGTTEAPDGPTSSIPFCLEP